MLSPQNADLINTLTRQKRYYDRHSKSLPPLKRADVACYRRNKMWNKSCVVDVRNEPRSYVIRNEHGRMRRNRRDLYKTSLSPQSVERQISHYRSSTPSSSSVTNSNHDGTVNQPANVVAEVTPARTSRSGRPSSFSVTNSNHDDTVNQPANVVAEVTPARTSRSGRPIRFPSKYRDYVCE